MDKYICPVCGYCGLDEQPYNEYGGNSSFEICCCCGFEFGFDDYSEGHSFKEYREQWIKNGFPFKREKEMPKDWNLSMAKLQLSKLEDIENDINSDYGYLIRKWNKVFEGERKKQ